MKCVVCRKKIQLNREKIYKVFEHETLCHMKVMDAIDCVNCGCQHLLKIRLPKVEGSDNK